MRFTALAPLIGCLTVSLAACSKPATYTGPTCEQWQKAPKNKKPYHPQLWTGKARALPAQRASLWPDWLVPRAYGFAYEEEKPLAMATIEVRPLDDVFQAGPPVATTKTDARGQWCVIVPESVKLDPSMAIVATSGPLKMRQLAAFSFDLSVNAQSEAFVRWLESNKIKPSTLTKPRLLNMRTLADSAAGLLGDVKPKQIKRQETLIQAALDALQKDKRLNQKK